MPEYLRNKGRLQNHIWPAFLIILSVLLFFSISIAGTNPKKELGNKGLNRQKATIELPHLVYTAHQRGNMQLAIANNGTFGTAGSTVEDALTGDIINACVYPKYSDLVYLWVGGLWIGAIVGRDTLVSTAVEDGYDILEFWPEEGDTIRYGSLDVNSPHYSPNAYSEEDITCVYNDTISNVSLVGQDAYDGRPHRPLNIRITQRSMAWSYSYADDFVLFDYQIENVGMDDLHKVYMGIFVDGDVWHVSNRDATHWLDDIVGFYRSRYAPEGCGFIDTVNIAFIADDDGDPEGNGWNYKSPRSIAGARVVRTPSDSLAYSFNWWVTDYSAYDFGPRQQHSEEDPFRSFGTNMGTPWGDRNKYYIMRHPEFDYDLMYTAINHSEHGWLRPPAEADIYADGNDARYLLSFGPFEISPGQRLPISFCWVAGENFHTDPKSKETYFDPDNPDPFYTRLNFSELAENAMWASWVYDNPGVDTDNDGYLGKYRVCEEDTFYYEGDGIPDFRGAAPPPAPTFRIEPGVGTLRIHFNGYHSETAMDYFSRVRDFEGYRVYIARDERATSYSVAASYDREDYNKYIIVTRVDSFTHQVIPTDQIILRDVPYSLDSLRCLYAPEGCDDEYFDPTIYTRYNPFEYMDSMLFFEQQDFNVSHFGIDTPIRKTYPDQPYPSSLNPDSAEADEFTEERKYKYFEYQVDIDNLLPTVLYWVNVTAFDFGSPASGLASLESSVSIGAQVTYALTTAQTVVDSLLDVYVYPNPYRVDGKYGPTHSAYENRMQDLAEERARRINFANLPHRCTISIFSLDGDLVRRIEHDKDPLDPTSSHEEWDVISRNTQAVVSGLYYYVVESEKRTQIGKLVIIR